METSPAESSRGDSPPPAARQSPTAQPLLIPTQAADSLAWMRPDVVLRLVPLAGLVVAIWLYSRPAWLGLALGWTEVQLAFGLPGFLIFFAAASLIQRALTRQRGSLRVPASGSDVALQAGYYLVNAPIEEAFFRGLVQGGLTVAVGPVLGILAGTSVYVLYHRLGRWGWPEVLATSLVGLPTALAFWLLPGPPSILAVSLAHAGATCGFLGPGPWLLNRLGLISGGDSPPPAAGQGPSAQPPLSLGGDSPPPAAGQSPSAQPPLLER